MGYHLERYCMRKQINMFTQLLEKNNISLPEGTKKKEGGSNFEDKEKAHALVEITVNPLPLSLILELQDTWF